MKVVVMNDGTEKTVTDKHARRLVYYKEAELVEGEKEEKQTPVNKKDKTKKETK